MSEVTPSGFGQMPVTPAGSAMDVARPRRASRQSLVILRQKDRRYGAIRLGDDPEAVLAKALARLCRIDRIRREDARSGPTFSDSLAGFLEWEPCGLGRLS